MNSQQAECKDTRIGATIIEAGADGSLLLERRGNRWREWPHSVRIAALEDEGRRQRHINAILMSRITMAAYDLESISDNVRVEDGRLEVWCLGDWVDVEKAGEEYADEAAAKEEE